MELLVIILLFMICVIAVAIRKDMKDMSSREQMQLRKRAAKRRAALETNKTKQKSIGTPPNK